MWWSSSVRAYAIVEVSDAWNDAITCASGSHANSFLYEKLLPFGDEPDSESNRPLHAHGCGASQHVQQAGCQTRVLTAARCSASRVRSSASRGLRSFTGSSRST